MGCGTSKRSNKVVSPSIKQGLDEQNGLNERNERLEPPKIAKSKDKDSQDIKRQKMLEAAEAREKKQKLHGLTEEGLKSYEEKLKRSKLSQQANNNYEPLNWNS